MPLSDTAPLSDSLSGTANFHVSGSDASAISDFCAFHVAHFVSVGDTLAISDSCAKRYSTSVGVASSVTVSDGASSHSTLRLPASETVSVSDSSVEVYTPDAAIPNKFQAISETVGLSVATALHAVLRVHAAETVPFSEHLSVSAASFAASSSGTSLTVGFPHGLRLDGVSDTERYRIDALDGGVPTMVLTATPIQVQLASGSGGTILGSGTTSNQFRLGSSPVVSGNYLTITGRWQVVTARVISIPSVGVVALDTPLVVDDPDNGNLLWVLRSAVTGAALTIHEPSDAKTYRITATNLLEVEGPLFTSSVTWVASVPGPIVVAAEYFVENGNILLTFSEELVNDSELLSPSVYSITGPTAVEVTGVRTASATQVLLSTTIFGTGTYTVNVDQP